MYHPESLANEYYRDYCCIRVFMVYAYTPEKKRRKENRCTKNAKNRRKENKNKKGERKTKPNIRSGRRPIPKGTRLLFPGRISPMIYPVGGPTQEDDSKVPDGRQEEARDEDIKTKRSVLLPAGGPRRTREDERKNQKHGRKRA